MLANARVGVDNFNLLFSCELVTLDEGLCAVDEFAVRRVGASGIEVVAEGWGNFKEGVDGNQKAIARSGIELGDGGEDGHSVVLYCEVGIDVRKEVAFIRVRDVLGVTNF
ncbi:hypothetical protein BC938DRAFT_479618 [Jimgerdemannia flammicorona]|uniref:Uncharacterized protein n=1 Tax=Jimgerdemannia flammicorona TaxID=994334 RepID=A0A433QKI3_9FUNG|nr:hypothetical protein BC938DRAFT_479618 [Jimgerdemannia flammicorona]